MLFGKFAAKHAIDFGTVIVVVIFIVVFFVDFAATIEIGGFLKLCKSLEIVLEERTVLNVVVTMILANDDVFIFKTRNGTMQDLKWPI